MATKKATTTAKTTTKKTAAPKAAATKATKPAVKKTATSKAAKTSEVKKVVSKVKDIEEAIRRKAEEIYHARVKAGKPGTPESDWHEAEKALKSAKKK